MSNLRALIIGLETPLGVYCARRLKQKKIEVTAASMSKHEMSAVKKITHLNRLSIQVRNCGESSFVGYDYVIFFDPSLALLHQFLRKARVGKSPSSVYKLMIAWSTPPPKEVDVVLKKIKTETIFQQSLMVTCMCKDVYGPGIGPHFPGLMSHFVKQISRYTLGLAGTGQEIIKPLYIKDAAETLVDMLFSPSLPSKSVHVAGSVSLTRLQFVSELKTVVESQTHKKAQVVSRNVAALPVSVGAHEIYPRRTTPLSIGLVEWFCFLMNRSSSFSRGISNKTRNKVRQRLPSITSRILVVVGSLCIVAAVILASFSVMSWVSRPLLPEALMTNEPNTLVLKSMSVVLKSIVSLDVYVGGGIYPLHQVAQKCQHQLNVYRFVGSLVVWRSGLKTTLLSLYESAHQVSPKTLQFQAESAINNYQTVTLDENSENDPTGNSALMQTIKNELWLLNQLTSMVISVSSRHALTTAIVFHNDAEWRGVGGSILGAYIVESANGRITSKEFRDIYALDGELNGLVEPPSDFKQLMNQNSWYFRDANWSGSKTEAAQAMAWFLEKETGKKPDLVIGVGTSVIRRVLSAMGESPSIVDGLITNQSNARAFIHNLDELVSRHHSSSVLSGHNLEAVLYQALLQNDAYISSLDDVVDPLVVSDFLAVRYHNVGLNPINPLVLTRESHHLELGDENIAHVHSIVLANTHSVDKYRAYIQMSLPLSASSVSFELEGAALPLASPSASSTMLSYHVPVIVQPNSQLHLSISYKLPSLPVGESHGQTQRYMWRYLNQVGLGRRRIEVSGNGGVQDKKWYDVAAFLDYSVVNKAKL